MAVLDRRLERAVSQAAVGAGTDFIDDVGLEIAVDGTGNIFALTYNARTR